MLEMPDEIRSIMFELAMMVNCVVLAALWPLILITRGKDKYSKRAPKKIMWGVEIVAIVICVAQTYLLW